jgi:hypothetical protein
VHEYRDEGFRSDCIGDLAPFTAGKIGATIGGCPVLEMQLAAQRWQAHCYWSIVENRRCSGGRVVQRQVMYLGEINDTPRQEWIRSIEVFDEDAGCQKRLKLFAPERAISPSMADAVQVRLWSLNCDGRGSGEPVGCAVSCGNN